MELLNNLKDLENLNNSIGSDLIDKKKLLVRNILKLMNTLEYNVALLVDSDEGKFVLNQLIEDGISLEKHLIVCKGISLLKMNNCVDYDSDWVAHIDTVIILRLSMYDGHDLFCINQELKTRKKDIVVFDQGGMIYEFTLRNFEYFFRGITYELKKGMLIPSYYYGDNYIDILGNLIEERHSHNMLDIFSGSGCIGLSCLKESDNLESLLCSDINSNDVESINLTIKKNNFDADKASSCVSDLFSNIPEDKKFDLISGNLPNNNAVLKNITDLKGADPDWLLHKRFFAQADKRLTDEGIICFIERNLKSDAKMFYDMAQKVNPNLELYDSLELRGSEYYLIFVRKK